MRMNNLNEKHWNEDTVSSRQHVLESVGQAIDHAQERAKLQWAELPPHVQDAINAEGYGNLADYGHDDTDGVDYGYDDEF